jgi:hypothetical protein
LLNTWHYLNMIMMICVSNGDNLVKKDFNIIVRWTEILSEEVWHQGDVGKSKSTIGLSAIYVRGKQIRLDCATRRKNERFGDDATNPGVFFQNGGYVKMNGSMIISEHQRVPVLISWIRSYRRFENTITIAEATMWYILKRRTKISRTLL